MKAWPEARVSVHNPQLATQVDRGGIVIGQPLFPAVEIILDLHIVVFRLPTDAARWPIEWLFVGWW